MTQAEILSFDDCQERFERIRSDGKRLVHCHGTFDLLHPGHIKHLAAAKELGDILVVSLTSAPFVNKGPGRPAFSDDHRAYQLAHLQVVDYVVIVPCPHAVEIIEKVKAHYYCKGTEYEDPANRIDKRVEEDAAAVFRHGGEVRFVGEPLHSSTRLVVQHLDALEPEVRTYLELFPLASPSEHLDSLAERIEGLRVLVVGDLIVDRYTYCSVQGLTSKSHVPSVRPSRSVDQAGGALAVGRHVATFGCETTVLTLAGEEVFLSDLLATIRHELDLEILTDLRYETIVKERFVERPGKRQDLLKHFSVNRLMDEPPEGLMSRLCQRLEECLHSFDLVIVCDYGHGMISASVQQLLEDKAPHLSLNCQTNSYNYGFNRITKYRSCQLLSLDEAELKLAFGNRSSESAELLARLGEQLDVESAWLTLGSSGSLVWRRGGYSHACPAMVRTTVDTVGAGDAFLAVAALCSRAGADDALTSVLANVAGALAANTVGNTNPVERNVIFKNAQYLLKAREGLNA